MNKESIYKLIGYNGEYNDNVKKAIRKLLKENHPDNNGDRKIFELINEVKKELEENKVSYHVKNKKVVNNIIDDIDYDYCFQMVETITKEKEIYTSNLDKLNNKLEKSIDEYKNNYQEDIRLETELLSNNRYITEMKITKYQCIISLMLTIFAFLLSLWQKNIIFLVIFLVLVVISLLIVNKLFIIMKKITDKGKDNIKKYVDTNNKLRENSKVQEKLKKEIHDTKKIINNLENDLRFYNNIFNNRR